MKLLDNLKEFYIDAKTEFKKISWPSRDEIKDSTTIVCVTIFCVMVVLSVYDFGIMGIVNLAQKLFR